MKSGYLAALLGLIAPIAAQADGLTPLLLNFGTPRTVLWGMVQERPRGGARFAFKMADQLGLNPDRTRHSYLAGKSLSFSPLLRYDRNVNNGFRGDTVYIFGLPFTVDEDSRAVEAVTVGGAVSGGVVFGIAQGTTLTISGRSEYQRALGKEFEVFRNTAYVGLGYTAQNWTYGNIGFMVNEEKRALGEERLKLASFTVGRLFGVSGRHLHDVSGTFTRAKENNTWQNRLRLDWTGTFADLGVFSLGLERGEEVEMKLLTRMTVSASYSNVIFRQPTTISVSYTEKTGGNFFGSIRNDDIHRIRVERKVNDRISVYMSVERKDSSIDSFSDTGIDVGVNFASFRF